VWRPGTHDDFVEAAAAARRVSRRQEGALPTWHSDFLSAAERINEMRTIVIVALGAVLFLAVLTIWPHSADWGYLPSGGLGFLILILAIRWLERPAIEEL
jgi:hypothetical protein